MFSKFNTQIKTIFLDTNSANFTVDKKVNVILSPSLYWVKKVTVPVKSLRELKPLLESLFEDTLPKGSYSYTAYKQEDNYFIFAYEDKKILDLLSKKGLSPSHVNNVYFAQSELSNIDKALKIDGQQSIVVKDGIVISLPALWANGDEKLNVKELKLSKHNVKLKQFGHIVDDKSLYTIVGLFVVFIVIVATEYFITENKITQIENMQNTLFTKYDLKPTMIQNRSMLKEYKSTYEVQTKLRNTIAVLLKLSLDSNQKIKFLHFKADKLNVTVMGVKKGKEQYIEKVLKSKGLQYASKFQDNNWYLEFSL